MKTNQPYPEFVARIIERNNGNPDGLEAIKVALTRPLSNGYCAPVQDADDQQEGYIGFYEEEEEEEEEEE